MAMLHGSKKRKVMTLDERVKVIKLSNSGESARKIAEKFGVGKTQVQTVVRNKDAVLEEWQNGASGQRKYSLKRKTTYESLNRLVWEWFCVARSKGLPVSGKLLKTKAMMFSLQLGDDNFMASNGWLESFKSRHNIRHAALSGEAADVDEDVVNDWKGRTDSIFDGYEAGDIYNADETGVFYRAMPSRSLVVRGDKCSGGKKSKHRLTLLLACSATGHKLKPLVIGHSKNPRCFKGKDLNSLRVIYRSNQKAWMTSNIFCEWLDIVNNEMKRANRKIVLLVDNCSAHPHVVRSNIKLVFLPPNVTSKLQPCDAGIIQAVKLRYRTRLLRRLAFSMDDPKSATDLAKKVTLFDAILWLRHAWDSLEGSTITKCFAHCGIMSSSVEEAPVPHVLEQPVLECETIAPLLGNVTLDEFASQDDALSTCRTFDETTDWEQDLLQEVELPSSIESSQNAVSEDEENTTEDAVEEETPVISPREAAKMIKEIQRFGIKFNKSDIVDSSLDIEHAIMEVEFEQQKRAKQTLITHFLEYE